MANIISSRKSGFIQRSGRMRRETLWFNGVATSTNLAAANTAALTAELNAAALALRPFTVVRTRVEWSVVSDQRVATEFFDAAMGWAVVTD